MKVAWLRTGDTWKRTYDTSEVINHDGDVVICETKEEVEEVAETLATQSGGYVQKVGYDTYIVSDKPIFEQLTDKALEVLATEPQITVQNLEEFVHHSYKNRVYYIAGLNSKEIHENIIAEQNEDSGFWTISINPELWAIAVKKVDKLRKKRKEHREPTPTKVTHPETIAWGNRLASQAGFQLGNSCPRNLIGGIILLDAIKGEEATNAQIKDMATRWHAGLKENATKFLNNKWLTEDEIVLLTKRFLKAIDKKEEVTEATNA